MIKEKDFSDIVLLQYLFNQLCYALNLIVQRSVALLHITVSIP